MSRITMERNSLLQNGASRIPRFDHSNRNANSTAFNSQQPLPSLGSGQKMSKLELMQRDYQKNIIKEKEEKIITMYEENQRKALDKVNQKKGHVREFFNERRAGSGGSHSSTTPTIEQLYRQKKEDTQSSNQGFGGPPRKKPVPNYPNYNRGNLNDKKQSAGRDRANLLAPIQRDTADSENPFAKRKPQIVRPRTYKGVQNKRDYPENDKIPRSAPNGISNGLLSDNNINDDEESPLPSSRQFQHLQQKRKMLQDQRQSNKARAQQQNARKPPPRRNGQYEYETSEEDEGYNDESGSNSTEDDMKKKQQELLAQIEAQQKELDRLRNDRMNAEIAEKKEMERRRKSEEERRKKRIEEERRREIAEEEERARQQWEEEKQQKIMMEKQRMKHMSQSSHDNDSHYGNSNYGNSYYDDRHSTASPESQYNHYEKKQTPAPPPKPKPTNTRKPPPKKQPVKQRSPSPLPSGDHTDLYANADNLEGAYENVGNLRACYNCGRKFAEDRLQKHEKSCKNITKKRKVMDPAKVRTRGTELEQYQGHRQPTPTKVKKNNWRSKHESFMQAIRYAKKASQIEKEGGNLADLPPPPPSENPDYVQCPYCSRKFNESAAERHIPHCKNSKARAKPPPQRRR